MESEEERVERQREASLAGLLFIVLLLFLGGALLIEGFSWGPAIQALSPKPPTSLPETTD
jgi:hypothetical protein